MTVALFSRFGGAAAAYSSLLAGAAVQIVGTYIVEMSHPFTWSLIVSAAAYAVVGGWTARRGRAGAGAPVPEA